MAHRLVAVWESCGLVVMLVALFSTPQLGNLSEAKILSRFTESEDTLRTMVYDPQRQRLYVGDTNSVHALTGRDLGRVGSVLLGPQDDHLDCPYDAQGPCPPGVERHSTDTISQLLLYDEDDDTLIACGTLFYGSCERIDLETLVLKVNSKGLPTVPNDPAVSVAAFYVPRSRVTYGFGVVFVGAAYSAVGNPEPRSKVHLLSTRRASNMDFLPRTTSYVDVLSHYTAAFPVEFVAAFEHDGYAYFLINRKEHFSTTQRGTFLFRFCLNDSSLHSLVELRLECDVAGSIYGRLRAAHAAPVGLQLSVDVFGGVPGVPTDASALYGLFTMDQADSPAPRGASAICVFSMKQLDQMAQRVIQKCVDGQGFTGPAYLVKPAPCTRKNIRIPDKYCGTHDVSYPVSDATPIRPSYSVTMSATTGTSLLVSVVNDVTVAAVGTADGRVVQAALRAKPSNVPAIYRETTLDKTSDSAYSPVKQLLFGQHDTDHVQSQVYALTSRMVYQVQLLDCEPMTSCTQCITDPYCGWCAISSRCTRKSSCPQTAYWLNDRCPGMVSVEPQLVAREVYSGSRFRVTVNFLPTRRGDISCLMEDERFTGPEGAGFTEKSPALLDSAPPGPDGRITLTCGTFRKFPLDGGVIVNMTLKITMDDATWATGVVGVYDCARLSRCAQCAVSVYPCQWCVERHLCMPSNRDCTSRSGNPGVSISDLDRCPRIEVKDNSSLVSADGTTLTGFSVTAMNMMRLYRNTLQCRFRLTGAGKVLYSKAKYPYSTSTTVPQVTVTCDPLTLTYSSTAPYDTADFDLVWENEQALDNPQNLSIRVYKCRHLVTTCGQCLSLSEGYNCGWCRRNREGGESLCTERGGCSGSGGVWMSKLEVCSDPSVTAIKPVGGPLQGGTLLTINGTNLGKVPEDLEITVAEKPCIVQREGYIPSSRVMCRTTSTYLEGRGPVVVTVNHLHTTPISTNSSYHYVNLVLGHGSLKPKFGPISGGTLTTILGRHLDHGSTVSVSVNGLHARIVSRAAESITFFTPRVSLKGAASIMFRADSMVEFPLNDRFNYVLDPTVTRTEPMFSLFSGGTTLYVLGTGLDAVQEPRMILHHGTGNKTSPCKKKSATVLECLTPDLSDVGLKSDQVVDVPVGWIMDNVTRLVYIRVGNWVRSLTYSPDPDIFAFKDTVEYTEEQQILEIKGTHMELLKQFNELQVFVGGAQCWIDKREVPDVLRCRMPEPDDEKKLNDRGLAGIEVLLGNFRRQIGYVRYRNGEPKRALIFGLVFGLALPLLIIAALLAAFVVLRRRKQKRKSAETRKSLPSLLEMDVRRSTTAPRHSNPYSAAAGNQTTPVASPGGSGSDETVPLKSGDADYSDFSILADDDKQYFQELLKRMNNQKVKSAAREIYIERERLELGNLLGKGHFGRVYAATLRDKKLKHPQQVAVKTIEDSDLTQAMMEKFLEEGIIMKNFDHPHVLSLIGMCLGYRKEPMVILPFMANGDLRTFVKDRRRNFTARQLLLLTQQVAEGMAYLSSLHYIHRDLAARNCMIDDRDVVKVADFGLSHQLYDKEYYSSKDPKSKLPIKWMALESLEEFVFTIKSDVWSFGVLTWELMTRGVTPYPDVEVFETRNYLASGRRLRKPKYCPDNVYSIMMDCWHATPDHRPSFSELVNRIEALLNPSLPSQPGAAQGDDPLYHNLRARASQDYLRPINPDSSFANTDSSFYPEA